MTTTHRTDEDNRPGGLPSSIAAEEENRRREAGGTGPAAPQASASTDDLLGRVVQGAHETIDRLATTAAPHVHKLQEQVSSACEAWDGKSAQLRAKGDEAAESLRNAVRENPLVAVGAALALGMLIARLSR